MASKSSGRRSGSSRSSSPKEESRSRLRRKDGEKGPEVKESRSRLRRKDGEKGPVREDSELSGSSAGNSRASGGSSGRKDASPERRKKQASSESPGRSGRKAINAGADFADALPSEREGLLLSKLEICRVVYDFRVDTMAREKEKKRVTLVALIELLSNATKDTFTVSILEACAKMVSVNLFRILEIRKREPIDLLEFDDEEPYSEPAWPHLQLVYEFLRLFFACKEMDPKVACNYFNQRCTMRLLELLDSDDSREREAVKIIVMKYYSRFTSMRSSVRKELQFACIRAAHEEETPNGMAELLELQSKVISGFTAPLKEEQTNLLLRVLIPLHKVGTFMFFHTQLIHCMNQFIQKDASLCYDIVKAVLFFWPCSYGAKQVHFIEELEQLLALLPPADFLRLRDEVLRRIILVITCPNSLVAERGLQLWSNAPFAKLINQHREAMFPSIISALYGNATEHWFGAVHGRTFDVLKMLVEADEHLFEEASAAHRRFSEDRERLEEKRLRKWRKLKELHEKSQAKAAAKPKAKAKPGVKSKAKAKAKSQTRQHREDAVMLTSTNYGVSVSADNALAMVGIDLQAIVVDSFGEVVSVVSQENFTAMKAGVVHAPCSERMESDENAEGGRAFRRGTDIWVSLPRLPPTVNQILFLLVAVDASSARKDNPTACSVRLIDGANAEDAANLELDVAPSGVVLFAVMERPTPGGTWSFASLKVPTDLTLRSGSPTRSSSLGPLSLRMGAEKNGSHFVDVLDSIGSLVREVTPGAAKPQRMSHELEKGSVVDILHNLAPKGIFFGAGWDFSSQALSDDQFSVEVSAVFFGSGGKELGAVCAETPSEFGVRHSGSGMLSAGVALNFDVISKRCPRSSWSPTLALRI